MNNLYLKFLKNLISKRIMVCGLGLSNKQIIKTFHENGAQIIACDARNESEISPEIMEYLKLKNIEYRLGKSYAEKLDCEMLIRTPGLSFFSDTINKAREAGIIVTSEMEIFFDFCPCKIIGVTGSDGKTTVTTIISEILKKSGKRVFVGGNIGAPLLPQIDNINENDVVVAELSSFQLMSMRKSPDIAVVTNLSPNHLDVHKDMQEYVDAKKNIFIHQGAFGKIILNYDNSLTKEISKDARGTTFFFSRKHELQQGLWVNKNGDIIFSKNSDNRIIINRNSIKLIGDHNLENYLAAIAAVFPYVDIKSIKETAEEFSGVEHRMEFVKNVKNVDYYNDSIATSPTRVISGCLSLFSQKIILIAGGYDKKIPFDKLGDYINKKVKIIILMGQTADKIEKAIKNSDLYSNRGIQIFKVRNMEEAVNVASENSKPNDIVVLSPACASFGMYKNFEQRGKHFKEIVNQIKGE